MLGLSRGDAHIIRNAGGLATDDAIRSLSASQRLLGTEEVVVVMHEGCGLHGASEDEFARLLAADGALPTWRLGAFEDVEAGGSPEPSASAPCARAGAPRSHPGIRLRSRGRERCARCWRPQHRRLLRAPPRWGSRPPAASGELPGLPALDRAGSVLLEPAHRALHGPAPLPVLALAGVRLHGRLPPAVGPAAVAQILGARRARPPRDRPQTPHRGRSSRSPAAARRECRGRLPGTA